MDPERELQKFLSHVEDPDQREQALELWKRIKGNLSKRQRFEFLKAWNTYLVQSDLSVFDQIIDEVLDDLDRTRQSKKAS